MIDNIIYFVINYSYTIMAVLFLIKAILFIIYKNRHWRLHEFLYFNQVNIKYTSTVERAKAPKIVRVRKFTEYKQVRLNSFLNQRALAKQPFMLPQVQTFEVNRRPATTG